MKKITVEFIRLALVFFAFIFIMALLFAYINHVENDFFKSIGVVLTVPVMCITVLIPLWMIFDLVKKNVADKSIFNLTFFVSIINLFSLAFAFIYLK